ncbi:5cb9f372-fab9-494a-a165-db633feeff0d [Sclerotinia trifoliorum]|uniref:5cb9f372-fab9-494a-a165-db633feeff0d n=1 Tax=Sclerotinia trifoliorum TaxID=28548 RepID=A0A8H2W6Z5_9HELO|nr:5cb9f372-fab9-494a-a165-db633feeff0d [Sclerotinia trifoliorum]
MQSCLHSSKSGNASSWHRARFSSIIPLFQLHRELKYNQGSSSYQLLTTSTRYNSTTSKLDELDKDKTSRTFFEHIKYWKTLRIRHWKRKRSIELAPIELLKSKNNGNWTTSNLDELDEHSRNSMGLIHGALSEPTNDMINYPPTNLRPLRRSFSNRLKKKRRLSSLRFLGTWLDLQDEDAREAYWRKFRSEKARFKVLESALPTILLQHMRRCPLTLDMTLGLRERGFSVDDLVIWAYIIQGRDSDEQAQRLLSSPSRKPTFILLEILRNEIKHVETFRSLLEYTWTRVFSVNSQERTGGFWPEVSESFLEKEAEDLMSFSSPDMELSTFTLLISRLLHHARHLLPSAVVPISHMVPPYLFHNLHRGSMSETLEPKEHGRFSEFLNKLLHALSRPSTSIPFGSMFHNWHAQRVLLSLANRTKPPLTIDRLGYHSVQAVLLAMQKTNEESRLATLQARGWPPWRVDQDGMDAQRSSDEDMSRVVFAIRQMKEAGYNTNLRTHVHHILGGQEDDGTPTIHTRSMSKAHIRKLRSLERSSPLNHRVWSARIVATRDVQEAWSAFKNFHRLGGTPASSIYHAMMEKIEAENRRTGRLQAVDVSPGQGKEVLPPFSDNFSDFYKEELRPPSTIDVMYETMRSSGIRPESDCLRFLISHARSIPDGIKYLRESAQRDTFLKYLIGHNADRPAELTSSETRIIYAFVTLLCRCADKLVPQAPMFGYIKGYHEKCSNVINGINADGVMPQTLPRSRKSGINPLSHALELIRTSQTRYKPTWYAILDALARPGIIIDPNIIGDPQDDVNSWRISAAVLQDFHDAGLELDPKGFQLICRCLEKAMLASFRMDEKSMFLDAILLVKEEFAKISSTSFKFEFSVLSHKLHGAILHAYIRVLGVAEDLDGLKAVVDWMVLHHNSLLTEAKWTRNGHELLRRTLTATRVFCNGTSYEEEVRELVESVDGWTWPTDEDARSYIEAGPLIESGDGSLVIDEHDEKNLARMPYP